MHTENALKQRKDSHLFLRKSIEELCVYVV
jgi:hypothetical protein